MSPLALHLGLAAALFGALILSGRVARFALAIVAGIAAWLGYQDAGMMAAVLPLVAMLVALAQSLGAVMADKRATLTADEEALYAGPLAALRRADARRFLDQGLWMQGRAGDTLTREGEQAAHLYWLAEGEAEVIAGGQLVGRCGPGQLVGEATVLSPDPATATVRLTGPARFWAAPAEALSAFLLAHPHTAHALEHGFNVSLREKLKAMNRVKAEG